MKDVILAALAKLDTAVDSHWTTEGLVNLNTFKFLAGGVAISREQLEEVAPDFRRENPHVAGETEADQSASEGTDSSAAPETATTAAESFDAQVEENLSVESFTPVEDLSEEELSHLCESYIEQIGDLNVARDKFNKMIDKKIAYLHSVKAELDKRQPQMSLADMVRLAHENVSKNQIPANAPRARPHTVYPLLKK
jgi:hypothetical protein